MDNLFASPFITTDDQARQIALAFIKARTPRPVAVMPDFRFTLHDGGYELVGGQVVGRMMVVYPDERHELHTYKIEVGDPSTYPAGCTVDMDDHGHIRVRFNQ